MENDLKKKKKGGGQETGAEPTEQDSSLQALPTPLYHP